MECLTLLGNILGGGDNFRDHTTSCQEENVWQIVHNGTLACKKVLQAFAKVRHMASEEHHLVEKTAQIVAVTAKEDKQSPCRLADFSNAKEVLNEIETVTDNNNRMGSFAVRVVSDD